MSEKAPTTRPEVNEHEFSAEELSEIRQDLGEEAVEHVAELGESEISRERSEEISSSETAQFIDEYKNEHGSVRGLSMKELVEKGFNADMVLQKLGNERLEEKLSSISRGLIERGTEQWAKLEREEARYIPISDEEIDALMEAGANPQLVIDALQRTEPEDGIDNPNSVRIVNRMDKLIESGLPPAILAARLNPGWREAVKDKLATSKVAGSQQS